MESEKLLQPEQRPKPPSRWWFRSLLALLFIFLILLFGSGIPNHAVSTQARIVRARADTGGVTAGLDAFASEYGYHPEGSPSEILRALRGGNPHKIYFFECREALINPSGEFIDPWGQPYHIDQSDPSKPRVYSSGPNRIDEHGAPGSDDIVGVRERHR